MLTKSNQDMTGCTASDLFLVPLLSENFLIDLLFMFLPGKLYIYMFTACLLPSVISCDSSSFLVFETMLKNVLGNKCGLFEGVNEYLPSHSEIIRYYPVE